MGGLPRLSEESKESCEGFLTADECLKALKGMKNGKTPGGDGLPKEFYITFFHLFGEDFVEMINDCYLIGELTESQRVGLITLICKNQEKAHLLGFWRPISLLNVDYKIVSKALSFRLRGVLGEIIHADQTCAILGRSIVDSVHCIRNIYDFCDQKDLGCAFVNIDQSKAFDRVSHDFLFRALRAFGFGDGFISWIRLLYNNVSSSVIANGFISDPFSVKRSVRQGCSLSPMLYVICIEPFACRIRSDPHILGLKLPGRGEEVKIIQYADDNTIVVTSKQSIQKIFTVSELYGLASGAKINRDKSCGLWLGKWKRESTTFANIKWETCVKLLGFRVGCGDLYKENWDIVLKKFVTALNDFKGRNLSFRGRAIISDVMGASKIWYLGWFLAMPDKWLKSFNSQLFKFIWKDKVETIKRDTMINMYFEGGAGVVDIESKLHAERIMHVKSLIYGDYAKWHSFAIYWIGYDIRKLKPEFASNLLPHSVFRPPFYDNVVRSLDLLLSIDPDFSLEDATVKSVYWKLISAKQKPSKVMVRHPTLDFTEIFPSLYDDFNSPELRDLNFRIVNDILPVGDFLYRRNISLLISCAFCNYRLATVDHLFVDCAFAKRLWSYVRDIVYNMFEYRFPVTKDIIVFHKIVDDLDLEEELLFSMAKHCIWLARNRLKFDHVRVNFEDIRNMFLRKLKSRCIVDSVRLSLEDFTKRWSKGRTIANVSRSGIVDFLL